MSRQTTRCQDRRQEVKLEVWKCRGHKGKMNQKPERSIEKTDLSEDLLRLPKIMLL
jgi:hypothetical protein